jgi:hypothetical protein
MGLKKQAKALGKKQIDAMLAHLATTRHAKRNRLIFLLTVRTAGNADDNWTLWVVS